MEVLSLLVSQGDEWTSPAQVASELGITRATAYRTLEQLNNDGWVLSSGRPVRYKASLALASLGLRLLVRFRYRLPMLRQATELARASGRLTVVVLYDTRLAIATDVIDPLGERITPGYFGGRVSMTTAASGKILLAHADEPTIESTLREPERLTPKSKVNPHELLDELRVSKARNYAISDGEQHIESAGIASAVFDAEGNALGAIGLGCTAPLSDEVERRLAPLVVAAAAAASFELGFQHSPLPPP